MSVNAAIAERLSAIASMLELLGEDRFRVIAHQKAARVVADLPEDLSAVASDRARLMAIDGVGAKIADKIQEFVATGRMREHEELLARVPRGLLEVMEVPGLGPKTVGAIWTTLGVTDLSGLKRAIADGSILTVPRMGAKTVENIKAALEFAASSGGRLALGLALPVAERVLGVLRAVPGVREAMYAGSLRRGRETVGDIDVLVSAEGESARAAADAFCGMAGVSQVLVRGATKCSVRMLVDPSLGRWKAEGQGGDEAPERGGPSVQVDLRVVEPGSWGAALMYFTGSKDHNVRVRERALRRGLTLNEYGLFPLDDEKAPPQERGVRAVAGRTEEEVFSALGLAWVPPELREDRGELEGVSEGLIEVGDVRAELHAHTTASDGELSIEALVERARERGFHTIAVTDHSKSAVQANGLSVERLRAHVERVREVGSRAKGIRVLAGSEVDILADGSLDYPDEVLGLLDVVVASPHTALTQDAKAATSRLVRAVSHPRVNVLGHPTGRLINRRPGLSPDMGAVIAAAVAHGVALEINAHWMRLDLRDTHVRAALDGGAVIAINCDVHAPGDFDHLRYGVMTGRRGGLTAARCVNTWPAARLHAWLKKG